MPRSALNVYDSLRLIESALLADDMEKIDRVSDLLDVYEELRPEEIRFTDRQWAVIASAYDLIEVRTNVQIGVTA
jgi:hypothetical protein